MNDLDSLLEEVLNGEVALNAERSVAEFYRQNPYPTVSDKKLEDEAERMVLEFDCGEI